VKQVVPKIALSLLALLAGVVAAEFILRAVAGKVNYMEPVTKPHEILYREIVPFSGGHDAWGMRNREVPEQADIVAIGDSQTYGVAACAVNSWPAQLQRITGRTVYNMGMPGYGPVQYLWLLEHRALTLHPRVIVVGYYAGNDLYDAYVMAYCYEYWKHLRAPGRSGLHGAARTDAALGVAEQRAGDNLFARTKDWLGHHTVMYRMLTYSLLGPLKSRLMRMGDLDGVTVYRDSERNVETAFRTARDLQEVRLSNPDITEGMRICRGLFAEMNGICRENGASLVVLMIPTKEQVFGKYIKGNRALAYSAQIDEHLDSVGKSSEALEAFFAENGIAYVDPLDALEKALETTRIYAGNWETHPNKNGYRVIADAVKECLERKMLLDKHDDKTSR